MIGKDIPIGSEVDGIDEMDVFLGQAQSSRRHHCCYRTRLSNGSKVDDAACSLDARREKCLTDVIGRMSGLQDTDTSPWVYSIIKW
eukprot:scaffold5966_cov75-Skeletonema_dohrnii-CCMP3373.AAC.2